MRKILPALLLICLSLSACSFQPFSTATTMNTALAGLNIISYSVLGQSPVDFALSKQRGKYCDFRNMKKYGEYCIDPDPLFAECTVYCYRTLGVPDCTNMIDPHNNGNQPIVGVHNSCGAVVPASSSGTFKILPPPDMSRANEGEPLSLSRADDDLRPDAAKTAPDSRSATERGEFK